MEFTRTLKERQVTKHQDDILRTAEDKIRLADFDDTLFIAYDGIPLIPIEKDWMPNRIVEELSKLRQNYVNSVMKNYSPTLFESLIKA